MKKYTTLLCALFLLTGIFAQDAPSDSLKTHDGILKVFLICESCDQDFFKNEIGHLYFVRDQRLADFTVLFRNIETGSGGREITLDFSGNGIYQDIKHAERFNTLPNMSENDVRMGLLQVFHKGALHYLVRSPMAPLITYKVEGLSKSEPADSIKDKWNLWIFNIDGSVNGSGQEYTSNMSYNGSFSANRTSEKNLFEAGFWYWSNHSTYQIDPATKIKSDIQSYGLYSQNAISIGKHWAAGYNTGLYSSTVSNMRDNTDLTAVVEYNVFPYSEATKRQLRFNYRAGFRVVNFYELTYRNKFHDLFATQSLTMRYRLVEKWGNIGVSIGAAHLFSKEHFYSVNISPSISWNVLKGLNFNVGGNFSIVRDQYFLRMDEVSSEEILTGQAQLKSAYNFFIYTGFNYSFGSMYNNVVNVRFQGI